MKIQRNILGTIIILLIGLWAYAAFSKLFAFTVFRAQLRKSPLFTEFPGVVAIAVPLVEIALIALLFRESTQRLALKLSAILLSIFTVYLIGIINFSKDIPCSCGGVLQNLTWEQHIVFNVGFILMAIIGLWIQKKTIRSNVNLHQQVKPG